MFEHIGQKIKIFAQTLFWLGGTYLSFDVWYMLAQIADNSDAIAENSKKQLLALSRLETLLQKTDAPGPSPESAPEAH